MGSSVLYFMDSQKDLDSSEIASIMAQGSYACLYLINSFSSLLQSAESLSEICGLSKRVLHLLQLLSHEEICNEKRTSDELSQRSMQNNFTFLFILRSLVNSCFGIWRSDETSPDDSSLNEYMTLGSGEAELTDLEATGKISISSISLQPSYPASTFRSNYSHKGDVLIYIDNLCLKSPLDVELINALTLRVSLGDRIRISGPVGCGKSTLVQYIATEYMSRNTPTEKIRVDDQVYSSKLSVISREFQPLNDAMIDVADGKLDVLLRKYGVFQDIAFIPDTSYFFNGNLMENVFYPLRVSDLLDKNNEYDPRSVEAKIYASLEKYVGKLLLDLGLDHLLTYESKSLEKFGKSSIDWSSTLSNSERCLLSVARALLKKPLILICDNFPTVDAKNVLRLFEEHCSTCIITSGEEHHEELSNWCNKEIILKK